MLAGASGWRFGTTPATCTVLTAGTARCTAPAGTPGTVAVRFDAQAYQRAYLLSIDQIGRGLDLDVAPFEIITVRVVLA